MSFKRMTAEDAVGRINQRANTEFVRWCGHYSNTKNSSAVVLCKVHEEEYTVSMVRLLSKTKDLCPHCKKDKLGDNSRKPDHLVSDSFMATGKFVEGTKFTRNPKVTRGLRLHWDVHCPICAVDEYAQAGLCNGTFTAERQRIVRGEVPCRCSKTAVNLTDDQWVFRVQQKLKAMDKGLSYVGVTRGKTWSRSTLHLHCEEHCDFDLAVFSLLFMGQGCASCAKTGFDRAKPAHIYVLRIEGQGRSFTGYGISNVVDNRLSQHRRTLAKHGLAITEQWAMPVDGKDAQSLESAITERFPVVDQGISGFIKEATHSEYFLDVIQFVLLTKVELLAIG